jgi:hypothetical protein
VGIRVIAGIAVIARNRRDRKNKTKIFETQRKGGSGGRADFLSSVFLCFVVIALSIYSDDGNPGDSGDC